jgi:hypothetical protein
MNIQNLIENGANISVSVSPIDLKNLDFLLLMRQRKKLKKKQKLFKRLASVQKCAGLLSIVYGDGKNRAISFRVA